ncbi:T10O22.5 [Arabidopsis thaliana]|jgi:hypothetical protein|uniref:T10O22.5 n=1 Tax=Arabidopsis thaliana TaxID=3702 RepID=Q9LM38_ARATH|nr:T10O22.5 [Arabidopsis thaliana]
MVFHFCSPPPFFSFQDSSFLCFIFHNRSDNFDFSLYILWLILVAFSFQVLSFHWFFLSQIVSCFEPYISFQWFCINSSIQHYVSLFLAWISNAVHILKHRFRLDACNCQLKEGQEFFDCMNI